MRDDHEAALEDPGSTGKGVRKSLRVSSDSTGEFGNIVRSKIIHSELERTTEAGMGTESLGHRVRQGCGFCGFFVTFLPIRVDKILRLRIHWIFSFLRLETGT